MTDSIRGVVERITYHNEDTGYTVAQLIPEGHSNTVTVVGNMLGVNVGESVAVTGAWMAHAQYGRQFRADQVKSVLPATVAGVEKYLGSGLIRGIGPVTAQRIVRKFGLDTLRIIDEEPEKLYGVLGVGRRRIEGIVLAWREQRKIKDVMLFLQSHNVSTGLAVKIYKQYGDDAVEVVRADPYRLAREVVGIGFLTADKIARELGIGPDAPERVAAGVAYVLSEAANEGNVYLPTTSLTARAVELLGVSDSAVREAISTLSEAEQIRVDNTLGQRPADPAVAEDPPVYLTPFFFGEVGVTNRLRRLAEAAEDRLYMFRSFNWAGAFAALAQAPARVDPQAGPPVRLTVRQMQAVEAALTHRVCVITGGPGTGKTTTTRSIVRLADAAGVRTSLGAPTGRAARRLADSTGRPAKTIHRMLEYKPSSGSHFQRGDEHPLEADLVIIDEASMLDLLLTNHLLKAIPAGAHLLLVGDVDQLPSVGAGNVLRDIISAVEADEGAASLPGAAVVRLDTIFRQPEGSYIITNAHRVNGGELPIMNNRNSQDFFFFREEDAAKAADLVVDLVAERIPRRFGLQTSDIQVLVPMHGGVIGVGALNERLQDRLNPSPASGGVSGEVRFGGRVFRAGDRVMQIRNDYDKDIFNGDIGQVTRIDLIDQVVEVGIDDRVVRYDYLDLDELVHAYAISIHKSQGSEYPAVVVPLLPTHYMMLQRNLLYTAITRAKSLVVLVGSPRAIAIAVRTDRAEERFSGLGSRLVRLIGGEVAL